MDSILEVMQKIVNDRADEVEPQSQEKLDVHYGGCPMSDRVVYRGKVAFRKPSSTGPDDGIKKAGQHQPTNQGMGS